MPATSTAPILLSQDQWRAAEHAHRERAQAYTLPLRERRSHGEKHPVEDFLFSYYSLKPGQLERWHPGAGVVLLGQAAVDERAGWKHYTEVEDADGCGTPGVTVDLEAFASDRASMISFAAAILQGTASRPAQFACFGLHEWAMAYRSDLHGVRHEYLPLRLGGSGTDEVVESHNIRCSHFDAFRFYAPEAVGLNQLQPTRETQRNLEQPGCLHANMDLYKWAYKLSPAVNSELVMDCFELAWRVRTMDMQASPYDLADWGYDPIRIEDADGKATYVAAQRAFASEAAVLRGRLLTQLRCGDLLEGPDAAGR
ncbi:MAG: 3-methyladenine DNA glycosylase [Galactobacter sp.]